jgi:hypothetical protein
MRAYTHALSCSHLIQGPPLTSPSSPSTILYPHSLLTHPTPTKGARAVGRLANPVALCAQAKHGGDAAKEWMAKVKDTPTENHAAVLEVLDGCEVGLYTIHRTLCTPYTIHRTLCTPYTIHRTPYTLYTIHHTPYTVHSVHHTPYTIHYTPHTPYTCSTHTQPLIHSRITLTIYYTLYAIHHPPSTIHYTPSAGKPAVGWGARRR